MPRHYVKKYSYRRYTEDDLDQALLAIAEGRYKLKVAARKFGIPVGTLFNRFHGQHFRKVGRPTALPQEVEEKLVDLINTCAEWGFPLTKHDVRKFVENHMTAHGKCSKTL